MKIDQIELMSWQKFENISLRFHPRVTFLTGVNGTGKTSICRLLAQFIGYNHSFISSLDQSNPLNLSIGTITFSNDIESIAKNGGSIVKKSNDDYSYKLEFPNRPTSIILGAYIKSNRDEYFITPISSVKSGNDVEKYIVKSLGNPEYQKLDEQRRVQDNIPLTGMKNAIISWAVFGYGNPAVDPIPHYIEMFEGFVSKLSDILPEEIGFEKLMINKSDVMMVTNKGNFSIDGASSGLSTIIDLCWKCYISATINSNQPIIILDEPENHLHPSLQKNIIPNLVNSFPEAQFIIATHSPLIISSIKDSKIYVLKFIGNNITAEEVRGLERSSEYEIILQGALGVESSMPIWAKEEYKKILSSYSSGDLNATILAEIEEKLQKAGLEDYSLSAIHNIMEIRHEKNN